MTGDLITLEGAGAYNAAMHCASVSASRRGGGRRSPHRGAHSRTTSSMAALGPSTPPIARPTGHARSRSMGSASNHSSDSEHDMPAHVMESDRGRDITLSGIDDDESNTDYAFSLPAGHHDELYGQMPLKRRLRALGKRMMRSLRISNPGA